MLEEQVLKAWFMREIFPLEPPLTRFLRRNWRNPCDIADLRQDVYARVYDGARNALPLRPTAFLFTTARNHLINCARRRRIVSIEPVADLDALNVLVDEMTADRHIVARDELRLLQAGLNGLPPRCREVVMLRKVEGLSQREVAERMGVTVATVERQMVHGMRALVDFMLGGSGKIRRTEGKALPILAGE